MYITSPILAARAKARESAPKKTPAGVRPRVLPDARSSSRQLKNFPVPFQLRAAGESVRQRICIRRGEAASSPNWLTIASKTSTMSCSGPRLKRDSKGIPIHLAFAILPLGLGINALLRPASALAIFQARAPTDPYARDLVFGLLRIYGARNAAIGLSTLAMWYHEQFKLIGWTFLAGCLIMITDGFVAKELVGGAEWTHWCFTPIGVALGTAFLRK